MEVNNMPSGRLTSRTSVFISHKPLLRLKYTYIYIYIYMHSHMFIRKCVYHYLLQCSAVKDLYIYIHIYIFFGCFWGLWVMPEKIDDV